MRHSWILDVLRDLETYAELNDLPAIAASVAQTLGVAQAELAALHSGDGDDPSVGGAAD